jgi:hypothetical protein
LGPPFLRSLQPSHSQDISRGLGKNVLSEAQLEPFYGFARRTALSDANVALADLQANLELDDSPSIVEATKDTVLAYNKDDCAAAAARLVGNATGASDWQRH